MTDMSRRSLIQGSLALGAAGFIGAAEASTQAKVPSKWDATYDVVVVGSGFAGLAAAIEAKSRCFLRGSGKDAHRRRQLHY